MLRKARIKDGFPRILEDPSRLLDFSARGRVVSPRDRMMLRALYEMMRKDPILQGTGP